jgi:adenine deaminase
MKWKECVGLGEMMNFPGIIGSDEHTHDIVGETLKAGKTVTGHFSVPDTGAALNSYIVAFSPRLVNWFSRLKPCFLQRFLRFLILYS